MKTANDLRFVESLRGSSVPCTPPESENAPADSADGSNWESEWIDLGGEG
jgi:hypothetical protein